MVAVLCFLHYGNAGDYCLAVQVTQVPGITGLMRNTPRKEAFVWIGGEDLVQFSTQKLYLQPFVAPNADTMTGCSIEFALDPTSAAMYGLSIQGVRGGVKMDWLLHCGEWANWLYRGSRSYAIIRSDRLGWHIGINVLNEGSSCLCSVDAINPVPTPSAVDYMLTNADFKSHSDRATLDLSAMDHSRHIVTASVKRIGSKSQGIRHMRCKLKIRVCTEVLMDAL
jgi:hypothetical protein